MKQVFLIILGCILSACAVCAQNVVVNSYSVEVQQKTDEFCKNLAIVADNSATKEARIAASDNIMKLFIANGDEYYYYDEIFDQRVVAPAARININDASGRNSKSVKVKNYLQRLYNPQTGVSGNYDRINVTGFGVLRIVSVEKLGDHYVATASVDDKFISYKDGRALYTDMSQRTIRLYLTEQINEPLPVIRLCYVEALQAK